MHTAHVWDIFAYTYRLANGRAVRCHLELCLFVSSLPLLTTHNLAVLCIFHHLAVLKAAERTSHLLDGYFLSRFSKSHFNWRGMQNANSMIHVYVYIYWGCGNWKVEGRQQHKKTHQIHPRAEKWPPPEKNKRLSRSPQGRRRPVLLKTA